MRITKQMFLTVLLAGILPSAFAGPLHTAAADGDTEEVERLLNAGANIDEPGTAFSNEWDLGKTPLMYAAFYAHVDTVRLLLSRGARAEHQRSDGGTALFSAACGEKKENTSIVRALIDRGADVNIRVGSSGATPLMVAAWIGNVATVKLLLENGADWEPKNDSGQTAADIARGSEYAGEKVARVIETYAREAANRAEQEKSLLLSKELKTATLAQLMEEKWLDNAFVVKALTDAIITAKNKQLPAFLATATDDQKVDLLTSVEKQIARATAGIDEANADAGTAVSKGQDPAPFRKRAGQIKAYIGVLNEIKAILEQS